MSGLHASCLDRRRSDEEALGGEKGRAFSSSSHASSVSLPPATSYPPDPSSDSPSCLAQYCCCSLRFSGALIATFFSALGVGMLIICAFRPGIIGPVDEDVEVFLKECYNIFAILSCIKVFFSLLLFIGILRENADMVRPWLIAYFVLVPVELTMLVVAAFVAMFADYWLVDWVMLGVAGVMSVFYGFSLYTVFQYYNSISVITIINI